MSWLSRGEGVERSAVVVQALVAELRDAAEQLAAIAVFRRDLAAFASSVRATPLGDPATWRALAARWTRFATTLHHHHTAEDTLYWPVLVRAVEARGMRVPAERVMQS